MDDNYEDDSSSSDSELLDFDDNDIEDEADFDDDGYGGDEVENREEEDSDSDESELENDANKGMNAEDEVDFDEGLTEYNFIEGEFSENGDEIGDDFAEDDHVNDEVHDEDFVEPEPLVTGPVQADPDKDTNNNEYENVPEDYNDDLDDESDSSDDDDSLDEESSSEDEDDDDYPVEQLQVHFHVFVEGLIHLAEFEFAVLAQKWNQMKENAWFKFFVKTFAHYSTKLAFIAAYLMLGIYFLIFTQAVLIEQHSFRKVSIVKLTGRVPKIILQTWTGCLDVSQCLENFLNFISPKFPIVKIPIKPDISYPAQIINFIFERIHGCYDWIHDIYSGTLKIFSAFPARGQIQPI